MISLSYVIALLSKAKNVQITLLCSLLTFLSGCSMPDPKQDVKEGLQSGILIGPKTAPTRSITSFSKALRCMDSLLEVNGIYDVTMLSEDLKDNTGAAKVGARDMLFSAISDMTRRSHAIKMIAYGTDSGNLQGWKIESQDKAVYNSIKPQYDIRGSVSQSDKNVVKEDTNVGATIAVGQTGIGGEKIDMSGGDVLGLDLQVLDTKDMSLIPGVISKNQVVISTDASGGGLNGSIGSLPKFGLTFQMTMSRVEGTGQALRNLIELAAMELVGRLTNVPYWTCLQVDPKQEDIQNEIYDWYYNLKSDNKIVSYFQTQLRNRKFYNGPVDNVYNADLTQAVKDYQRSLGLEASGSVSLPFFTAFLNSATPSAPSIAMRQVSTSSVAKLDIHFSDTSKDVLQKGEQFQIVIQPNQDTHVACYYQSEDGNIQRFFPNRFNRDSLVRANNALTLPGSMPFKLFASPNGKMERMACFSSPTSIMQSLPASIKGTDFENLSTKSLNDIKSGIKQVAGQAMGENDFDIKVN